MRTKAHGAAQRPLSVAVTSDGNLTVAVGGFSLALDDRIVDAIAERVAEIVGGRSATERYLDVEEAAKHLSCSARRIYAMTAANRIPVRRDGRRLLFRASELNEWVERGGAKCP